MDHATLSDLLELQLPRCGCAKNVDAAALELTGGMLLVRGADPPGGQPGCGMVGHRIRHLRELVPDRSGMGGARWQESETCDRPLPPVLLVLLDAARAGVSTMGATLHCARLPDMLQAGALIEAGVGRVCAVFDRDDSADVKTMLTEAGVAWLIDNEGQTFTAQRQPEADAEEVTDG